MIYTNNLISMGEKEWESKQIQPLLWHLPSQFAVGGKSPFVILTGIVHPYENTSHGGLKYRMGA
jgi:hypothetical protein